MTVHRTAAGRRCFIRVLLRARTQDQPLLEAAEILRLLDNPALSLRTIERDLKVIRTCRRATLSMVPNDSPNSQAAKVADMASELTQRITELDRQIAEWQALSAAFEQHELERDARLERLKGIGVPSDVRKALEELGRNCGLTWQHAGLTIIRSAIAAGVEIANPLQPSTPSSTSVN